MAMIEFSEKDILASKIVEPAFYRVRIDGAVYKASNDQKSMNLWLEGIILYNAENGDKKFAGVPTPFLWMFNSSPLGMGNLVALVTSLGTEVTPQMRMNTDALVGKEIEMFIGNGMYNNQMQNLVTHQYRNVGQKAEV